MPVFADYSNRAEPFMSNSPRGRAWERSTRTVDDEIAQHVRADSDSADGLKMTVYRDAADRPIREFKNTGSRKVWMDAYKAPLQEQVALNTKELPQDQFKAIEAKWRADRAMREQLALDIAAGVDVSFDIETGERVK